MNVKITFLLSSNYQTFLKKLIASSIKDRVKWALVSEYIFTNLPESI